MPVATAKNAAAYFAAAFQVTLTSYINQLHYPVTLSALKSCPVQAALWLADREIWKS